MLAEAGKERFLYCDTCLLLWFNPVGQLSTTQLLAHSPQVGLGRESASPSARIHRLGSGQLKATHASKANQGIPSLLPIAGWEVASWL